MPAVLLEKNDITENPKPKAEPNTANPNELEAETATHKTAFMILITHDGTTVFEPNINAPVTTERPPTAAEIKAALTGILGEITAQEIAMTVISLMEMRARQAFEQQQNQAVLQQMGRMPGR